MRGQIETHHGDGNIAHIWQEPRHFWLSDEPDCGPEREHVPSNFSNDVFPPQMFETTVESDIIYGVIIALC